MMDEQFYIYMGYLCSLPLAQKNVFVGLQKNTWNWKNHFLPLSSSVVLSIDSSLVKRKGNKKG